MIAKRFSFVTAFCLTSLSCVPILFAQTPTAQISGRITDPDGAVVPQASITLSNTDTQLQRTVSTNESGYYLLGALQPGNYEISAEKTGFKAVRRKDIVLITGERRRVDFGLELGAVTQALTVNDSAEGVHVETETATLSHLVDGAQVRELALNGRNLIQLIMLLPGVATTTDQFDRGYMTTSNVGSFNISGMRATSSNLTLDGGANHDSGNTAGGINSISVDMVREVKVTTSGYSAEYGQFSGGQIDFTTRSGTAQYHGTLYEFFRNDQLNARSFFAPTIEKLRLNQFGWTFGGPLYLPNISARSNKKLFIFASQEYRRRIDGQTVRATMPTHAERSGMINTTATIRYPSNFAVEALRGQPITDPTRATESNPTGRNTLPRQYMTANGLATMKIFDTVEQLAASYTDLPTANNTVFQLANRDIRRVDLVRADYQLSPSNQFYLRYIYDVGNYFQPYYGGSIPTYQTTRNNWGPNIQLSWASAISSRSLNELAVTSGYLGLVGARHSNSLSDPATYGLSYKPVYGNSVTSYGIPTVTISGYTAIPGGREEYPSPTWDVMVRENFSQLRGKHTIKVGGLIERNRKNQTSQYMGPAVNFQATGPNTTGNALIDALLGNFRDYSETDTRRWVRIRYMQAEAYVNDSWKPLANLTFDLGLRYYNIGAPIDINNNISTFVPEYFDPTKAQQVIRTGSKAGQLMGGVGQPYNGVVVAGNNFPNSDTAPTDPLASNLFRGLPRGIFHTQQKLAPRFGFAYDLCGKGDFVLRGGAGVFYDRTTGYTAQAIQGLPFVSRVTLYDGKFDDPSGGQSAAFPAAMTTVAPDMVFPVTYKASFGFQKRLPMASLLDVNYVTTQARHLLTRPDINTVSPATQYANPGVNLNALRPYQGYSNLNLYQSRASSSYNGLQTGLKRRTGDFTYSVAYTWSKVLTDTSSDTVGVEDPQNFRRERSHATFDRNHIAVISYVYRLPFFGKSTGPLKTFAGGWQLSGITQFQSGGWLSPSVTTATGSRRPNRVGDPKYFDARKVQTLTGGDGQLVTGNFYFDPTPGTTFTAPASDQWGNSAPNILQGPGRNNWDMSLFKSFSFKERWNVQFRAEAFNVWNHTQFRNPNTSANSRNYGTISDAAPPRLIQFGMKLLF